LATSAACIEQDHRDVYRRALKCLLDRGVPFVVGGAFAVYHYTGRWRDTHDIDVFTTPENVPAAIAALTAAGIRDLGEQAAGDRGWIYHGYFGDIIVDVIWQFANRVATVDQSWLDNAEADEFLGLEVKFPPVENLVWSKMFTLNRHRCDWPDIMNIIRANCDRFNWYKLLDMLGEHWLLLVGLVSVFDWQYPADYYCIPEAIRQELMRRRMEFRPDPNQPSREELLDPWIHTREEDRCKLAQ
jgi:hypothetical protein